MKRSIENVYSHILDKIEDHDLDSLTPIENTIYLCARFLQDIEDGGFETFYFKEWGAGSNYPEVIEALIEIKAYEIASIVEGTKLSFPSSGVPLDLGDRFNIYLNEWDELKKDNWCVGYNLAIISKTESLKKKLIVYILDHLDELVRTLK